MKLFIQFFALPVALLFTVNSTAQSQASSAEENEVEVRGVLSIPSGEASFSSVGPAGSVISLNRDFNFHNELGFELRFTHRTASGKHKFQMGYGQTTWNRSTTLSRSFTFLGETYLANLNTS